MAEEPDWEELRALTERCEGGQPLLLTAAVRSLLQRAARQVGLSEEDASEALVSESGAASLMRECYRRIQEGSERMSDAMLRTYKLRDAGNLAEARRMWERLLAIEVVPLYRRQAQLAIEDIDSGTF